MNEHANEVRLVFGLGLDRELDRDCTNQPAFVEGTERDAQTRGINGRTPAPGLRKCTAYLRPGAGGLAPVFRLRYGLRCTATAQQLRCLPPQFSRPVR